MPYEHIVKGYEVSKGRYVTVTAGRARGRSTRRRTHHRHPGLRRARPDRPHLLRPHVLPRARQGRRQGLRAAPRGDAADRQGRHRAVRAADEGVALLRAAARASAGALDHDLRRRDRAGSTTSTCRGEPAPAPRELEMAERLVDSLATAFEPERYKDDHREKVLALVEKKAAGEEWCRRRRRRRPRW